VITANFKGIDLPRIEGYNFRKFEFILCLLNRMMISLNVKKLLPSNPQFLEYFGTV